MVARDFEARLRRLERIAVLGFIERHGLSTPGLVEGGIGALRANVARDCMAIVAEHREPVEAKAS